MLYVVRKVSRYSQQLIVHYCGAVLRFGSTDLSRVTEESWHTSHGCCMLASFLKGMYEFWHELLQGEEESPTIRFKGETPRYSWKQNAETIEVRAVSVLSGILQL